MSESTEPPTAGDDFEKRVLEVLDEVRPSLQMDGGDVEFKGIEDGFVKLHLVGACSTCPSATMTLQFGIERMLKEKVPGVKGVVPV
ncbi:NifU family protein [Planctomycetota bacterium]